MCKKFPAFWPNFFKQGFRNCILLDHRIVLRKKVFFWKKKIFQPYLNIEQRISVFLSKKFWRCFESRTSIVYRNILMKKSFFFKLSVENFRRYVKPQFYVSIGIFWGILVYFGKIQVFSSFSDRERNFLCLLSEIFRWGCQTCIKSTLGFFWLKEFLQKRCLESFHDIEQELFDLSREIFQRDILNCVLLVQKKRLKKNIFFFERKTNPLNFQILSETFAAFSPKLSEIEHKIFSFLSEKDWPDRRNCSSSVKRIFFDKKQCLENDCSFFNSVRSWAKNFEPLVKRFRRGCQNWFLLLHRNILW